MLRLPRARPEVFPGTRPATTEGRVLRWSDPVLLLTADEAGPAHAGALGAVGTIRKPFDPDDLMDAVSAVMAAQRTGPDGIGFQRPWIRRTPPAKR